MPGLGSFALAGAVGGIGESMIEDARQKREDKLAALKRQQELEDQETQHNNRMEQIAASKRRTGGRGRGLGGRGYQLNPRERDDLARAHKSMLDTGFFDGEAPTEAQMGARVEQIRSQNRNLSLSAAVEQAASEWGATEVSTPNVIERTRAGKWWTGEETYEGDPNIEKRYGFSGEAQSTPPSSTRAPTQPREQQAASPESAQALSAARDAIAQGADRNAVIARLKEMGIDPEGL